MNHDGHRPNETVENLSPPKAGTAEVEQSMLWRTVRVQLDEQELRMVLDGLYRIRQKHSGGYAARATALYERLAREQDRLEKEAR